MLRAALALCVVLVATACNDGEGDASGSSGSGGNAGSSGSGGGDAGPPRPFALGFTPFPHDVTAGAADEAFTKLATDGDLYAFHTTEGVAWIEAANDQPYGEYGASLRTQWQRHRAEADAHPGHAVYLAVTPLDDSRSRLADQWGETAHMTLAEPWASYTFDAPQVRAAYLSFCRQAIAAYQPDFLAIGIEVNLLQMNAPGAWAAYATLHRETYTALKQDHPTLPIFVTLTAVDLLEGWTSANHAEQMAALADLLPYSDFLALSFYPFMSAYLTEPIPSDTFAELAALSNGKPIAIAETGYPAQKTELPSFGLSFEGTPDKQDAWLRELLAQADTRNMPLIVNFVLRDYDALWQAIGAAEADAVWRDTGLYDEAGVARPALVPWKSALARERIAP